MAQQFNYAQGGRLLEQWSNGTQAGDVAAGYTAFNPDGTVASTRALTAGETSTLAALDTSNTTVSNRATLQTQAQNAMATNRTFTGLASPTNAQVVAEVQALARQMNGVIRLLLQQFDATN